MRKHTNSFLSSFKSNRPVWARSDSQESTEPPGEKSSADAKGRQRLLSAVTTPSDAPSHEVWQHDPTPHDGHPQMPALTFSSHDQAHFQVNALDEHARHFTMDLPEPWRCTELISLIHGSNASGKHTRLGIDKVWLQNGQLHAVGRHAKQTLAQFKAALILLKELGVGSPDLPGFLELLRHAPALMAMPKALQMVQEGEGGEVTFHGDRDWLSSVLGELTMECPSLACKFFLHLTPKCQMSLLRRSPTAVRSMVASLSDAQDQQALRKCFVSGLTAELRSDGDVSRILCWLEQCPRWAAASLVNIWNAYAVETDKTWWLHQCPEIAEAIAVLKDAIRPVIPFGMSSAPQIVVMGGAALPSAQPSQEVLASLREHGYLWPGSPEWFKGLAFIRQGVGRILTNISTEDLHTIYGEVIEVLNLLSCEDPCTVLLHTVLQEVAARYEHKQVRDDRLDWLLDKLSRSFARGFAQVTACAFQSFCKSPQEPLLQLQDRGRGKDAVVVKCSDPAHMNWILASMIRHAGGHAAFRSTGIFGPSQLLALKQLLGPDVSVAKVLAPLGLARAHWRVRYLFWRELAESIMPSQAGSSERIAVQCDVIASVMQEAANDLEEPVLASEVAMFTSFLASARNADALVSSMVELLHKYPDDVSYQRFMTTMILNVAGELYSKTADRSAEHMADELMAMLCRENVPIVLDVRFAEPARKAVAAWTEETLKRWIECSGGLSGAGQCACAWMAELVLLLDPDTTTAQRKKLAAYVHQLRNKGELARLDSKQRSMVAIWLGTYEAVWPRRIPEHNAEDDEGNVNT